MLQSGSFDVFVFFLSISVSISISGVRLSGHLSRFLLVDSLPVSPFSICLCAGFAYKLLNVEHIDYPAVQYLNQAQTLENIQGFLNSLHRVVGDRGDHLGAVRNIMDCQAPLAPQAPQVEF